MAYLYELNVILAALQLRYPTKPMVVIVEYVDIRGKNSNHNQIFIAFFMIITKVCMLILELSIQSLGKHLTTFNAWTLLNILGLE